ncbi:MAG: hypothetical protein HY318_06545 [Armatimonadetes bacterium]|nr:hypothetical protein [Armatimonadota bacterium]
MEIPQNSYIFPAATTPDHIDDNRARVCSVINMVRPVRAEDALRHPSAGLLPLTPTDVAATH